MFPRSLSSGARWSLLKFCFIAFIVNSALLIYSIAHSSDERASRHGDSVSLHHANDQDIALSDIMAKVQRVKGHTPTPKSQSVNDQDVTMIVAQPVQQNQTYVDEDSNIKNNLEKLSLPRKNRDKSLALEQGTNMNNVTLKTKDGEFKGLKRLIECPERPKELIGNIETFLNPVEMSDVERSYPQINSGGRYHPKDCVPQQKLAIIIPYRNRASHLNILLNNLLGLLIKQKLDFTIFVIEQDLPTSFNRGMLFNVGYLEALKRDNYTCFIFHDVDMIPTNDQCMYRCANSPIHFLSNVTKWPHGLPYKLYFGGVVAFTKEQFSKVNGDSNLYFGWGGEDDDLRLRVLGRNYALLRYTKDIGRYDTISHELDKGNAKNSVRVKLKLAATARQDLEGLNTAKYTVTKVLENQLFTKINVFIDMRLILKDFKHYLSQDVIRLI